MADQGNKFKPAEYPDNPDDATRELDRRCSPIEDEIKALQMQRGAERKEWSKTTGIALGVYDGARKDAKILDADRRRKKLNDYNQVFNALSVGEQMNFIVND